MGSFTRNPLIKNKENIMLGVCQGVDSVEVNMFVDKDHEYIKKNIISMGNDAAIVYIIIYILA